MSLMRLSVNRMGTGAVEVQTDVWPRAATAGLLGDCFTVAGVGVGPAGSMHHVSLGLVDCNTPSSGI